MDDINVAKEFTKFKTSIEVLSQSSEKLKQSIDEVIQDLSKNLVSIKEEEKERTNRELELFSNSISSKNDELGKFVQDVITRITEYNDSIKKQIEDIKTVSQEISDDSASKFSKALSGFDEKMKALDDQIQKIYSAGLKSDFDNLTRSFTELERTYTSLSNTVQGSFIQPINEIKNDLKNLELKIESSFNNTNNNLNNRFDNVINKMELLSRDEQSTAEKIGNISKKIDDNGKKINFAILLAALAFLVSVAVLIIILIK